MKFIVPHNYKFKNKIFGIIDYPTALLNILWDIIIYFIIKNFSITLSSKIFIFSALSFPVLLLTIIGFNNESPLYTFKYLIAFIKKPKIYIFEKNNIPNLENKL